MYWHLFWPSGATGAAVDAHNYFTPAKAAALAMIKAGIVIPTLSNRNSATGDFTMMSGLAGQTAPAGGLY